MSDSIKPSTRRPAPNSEQMFQDGQRSKIPPIAKRSFEQRCFRIQGDSRIADRLTRRPAASRHQEVKILRTATAQDEPDLSKIKEKVEQVCEGVQELVHLIDRLGRH